MVDDWTLIYELRADVERVRRVQAASINRPGFGFPTTPYYRGSREPDPDALRRVHSFGPSSGDLR